MTIKGRKNRALVLLFGAIEYDGRVKRMIKALENIYDIELLDAADFQKKEGLLTRHDRILFRLLEKPFSRHVRFFMGAIRKALLSKPVLVITEDVLIPFTGLVAARLCGAQLAYDAHELVIPEDGIKFTFREMFFYYLEKITIHHVGLVIAANTERADLMRSHYRLPRLPAVFQNIPFIDLNQESPEMLPESYLLKRTVPDEIFVVYQGDMCLERGIEIFLQAVLLLPEKFRFILIGRGPDIEYIKKIYINGPSANRFIYLGKIDNRFLAGVTKQCDIGIITYPRSRLNNIFCASNKIFEYVQAGIPVISTDQPPLRDMIRKYELGELVIADDDSKEIARKIKVVAEAKEQYLANRNEFLSHNNFGNEAKKVTAAFEAAFPGLLVP
jgi:glycosyltransferase involved in cell wall biosynthesis